MKNFFKSTMACFMIAGLCATLYGCNEESEIPEPQPTEFNLLSNEVIVADPVGGNYTIEYEIVNPIEGESVTATVAEGTEWISNIDCSTEGTVNFDVAENTTDDPRSTLITLSYNDTHSLEVEVTQESNVHYDIRQDALDIHGRYFGYQSNYDTYCFMLWIALEEDAFDESGDGCKETSYYRLDLYGPEFEDASTQYLTNMPTGTYKFDPENTLSLYTFSSSSSSLDEYYQDDWGYDYNRQKFTDGELVIEESETGYLLVLKVTTEDGKTHRITYNGAVNITNMVL